MIKKLNQTFFKGLIVILPISLTFYLLFWIGRKAESIFGGTLPYLLGDFYIPGMGILIGLGFVLFIGVLVNSYLIGRAVDWFTLQLEKFPLIKTIYNPLKDLMALLPGKSSENTKGQRVVMVEIAPGSHVVGLVTREDLPEIGTQEMIAVYVPFSYMLGGVTVLVEKEKAKKIDLPVDQALKLGVTAWIKAKQP